MFCVIKFNNFYYYSQRIYFYNILLLMFTILFVLFFVCVRFKFSFINYR